MTAAQMLATDVGIAQACVALTVARATYYRRLRPSPAPEQRPRPVRALGDGERRDQLRHPAYAKPELLATAANQVWSWDITKLRGAVKWSYFHLYVILDIFSRYVVGWMVAARESAELACKLIDETIAKEAVPQGQLTIHADRGTSMTSKPVALLLA